MQQLAAGNRKRDGRRADNALCAFRSQTLMPIFSISSLLNSKIHSSPQLLHVLTPAPFFLPASSEDPRKAGDRREAHDFLKGFQLVSRDNYLIPGHQVNIVRGSALVDR